MGGRLNVALGKGLAYDISSAAANELDHAVQVIETTGATFYEAELLGVAVGTAMLLVRGVTHLADGRPIEFFKNVYRGDRFRFQLEAIRLHK